MANLPYDCYEWDSVTKRYDENDEKLYRCNDCFGDIVKMLYSEDKLDREELEDLIEEMCKLLKVSLPDNFLNVERRKNVPLKHYFTNLDMKSMYITNKTI
jgi:uncharacterized protein YpuA (DUF1002 family)